MLEISAVETATAYVFTVRDDTNKFVYEWGKQPPVGQVVSDYLQTCKREALLLAEAEIALKEPPTKLAI